MARRGRGCVLEREECLVTAGLEEQEGVLAKEQQDKKLKALRFAVGAMASNASRPASPDNAFGFWSFRFGYFLARGWQTLLVLRAARSSRIPRGSRRALGAGSVHCREEATSGDRQCSRSRRARHRAGLDRSPR